MGAGIMFVILFAASIAVGVCVLAYAARCVLVIVQETGLGQDEVVWPNEPYVDWLAHAVQFLELVGIWLAPAALTARLLRETWLPDDGALRVLLLAGPGLWLFFPIGLFSSLSAQSRWVPFRWIIFRRFLRVAPSALVFYVLSAAVLIASVIPWYYAIFGGQAVLLPVAAAVSAAGLFIYARLLGRLAWIIQQLPAETRVAVPVPPADPKPTKPRRKKKRKPAIEAHDPWAVSEEEERARQEAKRFPWAKESPPQKPGLDVPSAYEIEGYGVSEGAAPPETPDEKPPRSRFAMSPEEYDPIAVRGGETPVPPAAAPQCDLFDAQVRHRLAERTRVQPKLPDHPFVSGVYTFPWYARSLPNWLALALAFLVVGFLVYLTLSFGGQLFGW